MYDHTKQFRCTIIRGKAQKELDSLLLTYAKIIDNICPCNKIVFKEEFNKAFSNVITSNTKKRIDNHRTEIAGKLFGMYYTSLDDVVYTSERTTKLLADNDTPAFFKDICYKMQFPNGSQAIKTVRDRVNNNISIRQFPFILKVMQLAAVNNIILTKKEIGYYILNSLDVLQGRANPLEVIDEIIANRQRGITSDVGSGSRSMQHINEQLNLLELANLVVINKQEVCLYLPELETINLFSREYSYKPEFDVYSYELDKAKGRKSFYADWNYYYSRLSDYANSFDTTAEALGVPMALPSPSEAVMHGKESTVQIGDEGERFVYECEKRRVMLFNPRLTKKVIYFGKTRGLGYDIQSVVAVPGDMAEYVKYIEVKSTKRVTAPNINDDNWRDTLNITRNEWIAFHQHNEFYSIYRVFLSRNSITVIILTNIAKKCADELIRATPLTYRIDYSLNAVDEIIRQEDQA
ncbi:MAG: DUF3883 domain-containing protein [Oscillospiraceae bacterium]|nr:DUF3883 domain-containing protein [Oscillospiraceae bacterium]